MTQRSGHTTSPTPAIIPRPVKARFINREFLLNESTLLSCTEILKPIAQFFQNLIGKSAGFLPRINLTDTPPADMNGIVLNTFTKSQTQPQLGREGYRLNITSNYIEILANSPAGVFYGIQTLRQLFPPEIESNTTVTGLKLTVPCGEIEDYPRFSWRGYMVDEGRYFLGKDIVKRVLDLMVLHKLNTFHWHLTEDQGWRIEMKKYPKLTEVGSKLKQPIVPRGASAHDKIDHPLGGFYSQADIKEIVAYATERFINVIPEIEMPGHSTAAVASYPELGCTGEKIGVASSWGVKRDVYCAGKEGTYEFLQSVLDEVIELFPSEVIHTGGDEVPKAHWEDCPHCKARMEQEKIPNAHKLQAAFTNRISKYLESKGRRLMGWNEILDEGLAKNAICHYWKGTSEEPFIHVRNGRELVSSYNIFMYIDYTYWMIPLRKAYEFDPIPSYLEPEYHSKVLGLESPMWGEVTPNLERLEWQSFPRVCAYAETGWTPARDKNYSDFITRLQVFNKRLDILGVHYAKLSQANLNLWNRLRGIFKTRMG